MSVVVIVVVSASPDVDNVAVLDRRVRVAIVPPVPLAFLTPTCAIVTGSESDPFAVCVLLRVLVEVPAVWA